MRTEAESGIVLIDLHWDAKLRCDTSMGEARDDTMLTSILVFCFCWKRFPTLQSRTSGLNHKRVPQDPKKSRWPRFSLLGAGKRLQWSSGFGTIPIAGKTEQFCCCLSSWLSIPKQLFGKFLCLVVHWWRKQHFNVSGQKTSSRIFGSCPNFLFQKSRNSDRNSKIGLVCLTIGPMLLMCVRLSIF